MSYWKESLIDVGQVKEDKVLPLVFEGLVTIPEVIAVQHLCGCTKGKYDAKENKLAVTFKTGKIPNQVVNNQPIMKSIIITYKDGSQEVLYIQGVKTR